MRLNRYGFNILVLGWLSPVFVIDVIGNSTTTGVTSDFYFVKSIVDVVVLVISAYFVYMARKPKSTIEDGAAADTIISADTLLKAEHWYCLVLFVYALFSFWVLHEVNKASTGFVSFATLIWSFGSLYIAGISLLQFLKLKGKAIASAASEMKDNMLERDGGHK